MSFTKKIRLASIHWHKYLAWSGTIILCLYLISAITHPLASWTGPKAATFRPPTSVMTTDHLKAIPKIIALHKLTSTMVIKIMPSEKAPLLQVTEKDFTRRYFDLNSHQELLNYDVKQARWLAKYYSGDKDLLINTVTLQTEFDDNYPWVNRLLPVYKIEVDSEDNKVLYIYTEFNALASISNNWKNSLQFVFKKLHTWDFLNGMDNVRVVFIALMILTLFLFILSGIGMIFTFKSRKIISPSRRWHRRIAYLIWIPLLGFSTSGFYHLLQSAYGENNSGIKVVEPLALDEVHFGILDQSIASTFLERNVSVFNQISIISDQRGELLFRLSLPHQHQKKYSTSKKKQQDKKVDSREKRYKGISAEKSSFYFSVKSGSSSLLNDKTLSERIALRYLNEDSNNVVSSKIVTRFGSNYDFRNKRLPVWKVDFDNSANDVVFVDPVTGIVVDHTKEFSRYERLSFSFLHKWNFLTPLMGRKNRDILVVLILSLTFIALILGVITLLNVSARKKYL